MMIMQATISLALNHPESGERAHLEQSEKKGHILWFFFRLSASASDLQGVSEPLLCFCEPQADVLT